MMETERVILSAIEPEHIPAIVRWRSLPQVYEGFIEYEPLSTTQQAAFLAALTPSGKRKLWLINARKGPKADAIPIGTVGIIDLDWRNRRCEFGPIFIGELEYRRQGLATEAEVLVLDYCFNHHEAAGFRHDTLLRDHIFRNGRFEGLHLLSCLSGEFRERFPTGSPTKQ
jgi:RimJ/RimL family protein N-acetyltransferase